MEAADPVALLADDAADVGDAYVTMCVHAGIAAADVICCKRLGEHSRGENHSAAVDLLRTADPESAKQLSALLGMKTKAGYSALPVSTNDDKRAGRAAQALVDSTDDSWSLTSSNRIVWTLYGTGSHGSMNVIQLSRESMMTGLTRFPSSSRTASSGRGMLSPTMFQKPLFH